MLSQWLNLLSRFKVIQAITGSVLFLRLPLSSCVVRNLVLNSIVSVKVVVYYSWPTVLVDVVAIFIIDMTSSAYTFSARHLNFQNLLKRP